MEDMKSLSLLLSTIAEGCDNLDAISLLDVLLNLLVLELSQQYETLGEATLVSMLNNQGNTTYKQDAQQILRLLLRGEAVVSTQSEVG